MFMDQYQDEVEQRLVWVPRPRPTSLMVIRPCPSARPDESMWESMWRVLEGKVVAVACVRVTGKDGDDDSVRYQDAKPESGLVHVRD